MENSSSPGVGIKAAARWAAVFVLGALAGCLLTQVHSVLTAAQAQPSGGAGGSGLLMVAGQLTRDSYGLYLVDAENSTINVYQWMPESRKLQLLAGRSFLFDRQLDEYNTEPSPRAIKEMVEKARRLGSPTTRP
jgi:hypothetical protein